MRTTVFVIFFAIWTMGCDVQQGTDQTPNEGTDPSAWSSETVAALNAQQTIGNNEGCIVRMCGNRLCCSQIYEKDGRIGVGTTEIPADDRVYVSGTLHAYSTDKPGLKGGSGTNDGVVGNGGRYGINAWSEGQCGAMLTSNIGWGACIEGDAGAKVTGHNGPALSATSLEISQPPNIPSKEQWVDCPTDGEYGCPDGLNISKVVIAGGKVTRILCKSP